MSVSLAPVFRLQLFDNNGKPLAGGKLYSYQAGTTTPQATYTDATQLNANANPVILDSSGCASVWLDVSLSYKLVLKDSNDNLLTTTDSVIGLSTNNSVATASIQDLAVTNPKLADNAADARVVRSDTTIDANRAITKDHIRNAAIVRDKLSTYAAITPNTSENFGLATSVASNAFTIAAKTQAGTDATANDYALMVFRSSTGGSSQYSIRKISAAISLTIPSTATLGHVSAVNQYIWIYALDNAGTIELAVSGVKPFPDNSIQSTSAISTGSTDGQILYSASARSNVPIRLIGRALVNQTTAGTWAANTSDLVLNPVPVFTTTEPVTYVPTITAFGTLATPAIRWYRRGRFMEISGPFRTGTVTSGTVQITIPAGDIDTAALGGQQIVGTFSRYNTGGSSIYFITIPASGTTFVNVVSPGNGLASPLIGTNFTTAEDQSINTLSIPIKGWSSYGP